MTPEIHLLNEVNDDCTGILTIVGSEEDGKRLLVHWDRVCDRDDRVHPGD